MITPEFRSCQQDPDTITLPLGRLPDTEIFESTYAHASRASMSDANSDVARTLEIDDGLGTN